MTGGKGEFELIRRLTAQLAADNPAARVPFGDDMAGLAPPHERLLLTCDMLMDGVDFRSGEHSWRAIGRKAMAVNLSDCAAMAVQPVGALCAVALNDRLAMDDALELLAGLRECGNAHGCPLVGGDTNSWTSPTVISVTIAGSPPAGGSPVRRDGAKAGDGVFVSGPLGGSILGRHMTFEPRIKMALDAARELRPHAMIDISDGLAIDLWRVLDASGVGAALDEAALRRVVHADAAALEARDGAKALDHALYDGEDFELLICLPADADPGIAARLGLFEIGRIVSERSCEIRREDGARIPVERRGWEHFQ